MLQRGCSEQGAAALFAQCTSRHQLGAAAQTSTAWLWQHPRAGERGTRSALGGAGVRCHRWVPSPPLWVDGCKEFPRDRTAASPSPCSCLRPGKLAPEKRIVQNSDRTEKLRPSFLCADSFFVSKIQMQILTAGD